MNEAELDAVVERIVNGAAGVTAYDVTTLSTRPLLTSEVRKSLARLYKAGRINRYQGTVRTNGRLVYLYEKKQVG